MTTKEFKEKYFSNNFYWVDRDNYKELQRIGIEVGCLNLSKKPIPIYWHDSFVNLGFRTYEENNNITAFQKESFLTHNEKATSYKEMLRDYKSIG